MTSPSLTLKSSKMTAITAGNPVMANAERSPIEVLSQTSNLLRSTKTSLTPDEVNRLINYNRRYALALLGPAVVLLSGMALHYGYIREAPDAPDAAAMWLFEAAETLWGGEAAGFVSSLGLDFVGMVDSFYWAVCALDSSLDSTRRDVTRLDSTRSGLM